MRISDWSSDVCSSDLIALQQFGDDRSVLIRAERQDGGEAAQTAALQSLRAAIAEIDPGASIERAEVVGPKVSGELARSGMLAVLFAAAAMLCYIRSEEHTSELQSLMRISYAVFCLKKKNKNIKRNDDNNNMIK